MTAFLPEDRLALQVAKERLEQAGLAARLTNMLGAPIEKGFAMLPKGWHRTVTQATEVALTKAAGTALRTLGDRPGMQASNRWHQWSVAATGAAGGVFGMAGLWVELPVSTTLMLRSIADIARSEGEALADPDTQRACIEVFALGGRTAQDDALDSAYFAIRAALASSVTEAGKHLASKKLAKEGAPAMIRLITLVAQRFGVQVTEKVAAQAVPAVGAAGGAVINTLFMRHFQEMAQGHFVVRRLERRYGAAAVRELYDSLPPQGQTIRRRP